MCLYKKIAFYSIIFLLNCFCISAPESSAEFIQQEQTTEILKILVFTDKNDAIGNKWENFIRERIRRFGNNDYQIAIYKLKSEYDQSYERLNACIEDNDKEAKRYSSTWTTDLQKQFGREYIQKNYDSIRFVVLAISMRNNFASCNEQVKEALYREYRHLDAAKYYVKKFVEFSETLNKEENKKISSRITSAESYLKNFEYPLQSTCSDEGLKDALFSVAIKAQTDLDPRLMDFFIHQPLFMKPFALMKALDDLKTLK